MPTNPINAKPKSAMLAGSGTWVTSTVIENGSDPAELLAEPAQT